MNRNRLLWLDVLRGGAIILVVLGHSVQWHVADMDDSRMFRIIYSFHMPLFMFISGIATWITSMKKPEINQKEYVVNSFCRLFVPFIAWFFLPYVLFQHSFPLTFSHVQLKDNLIAIVKSPDHGLWFLYVLFMIKNIYLCMHCINRKYKIPFLLLTLLFYYTLYGVSKGLKFYYLGIGFIRNYLRFFMAGFIAYGIHVKHLRERYRKTEYGTLCILSCIFVLTVQFWCRRGEPTFMNSEYIAVLPVFYGKMLKWVYLTLIPYCGIAFSILAAQCISRIRYPALCIAYIGTFTLEIYAVHYYAINSITFLGNGRIGILANALVGLSISLIVALSLRGCILSKVLFGK